MSKALVSVAIAVISSAQSGYRRGSVELSQGHNQFKPNTFTEEQLQQLLDDPRLTVAMAPDDEELEIEPGTGSEAQGTVDASRLAELVKHIASLDKDDSKLWKEDGTPKATAYPKGTTPEEREAAWDAFVKQLDGAE